MDITFGFYTDSALTTPLSSSLLFVQDVDSPVAQDKVIYFGSPVANSVAKAASNPDVDQVELSVSDSLVGIGSPVTDVKLALSLSGLNTAVGGASLALGTQVLSGMAGAKQIFIRVLDSTHVVGNRSDLSIVTTSLAEFAV